MRTAPAGGGPLRPIRALLRGAALAGLLWCAALPARAADSHGQDVRFQRLHVDLRVNGDGTYVQSYEFIEQLNSPRAVEQAGQIRLPYSASLDDFQVVEANTLKREGRRIPVARSSIFTQDGLISPQGLTSFQDIKTTVVVFPDLDPGDSIQVRVRISRKKAMLPGIFTYVRVFDSDVQFDDAAVTLVAPKGLPLTVENVGLDGRGPEAAGDELRWSWSYHSANVEWPEEDAVDPLMYRPHLLISSASSYASLAAAARALFEGKAQPSPAVRAVADQVTQNARTPQEQARRLHEWVARNIRYFAVELDLGGYVPRQAEEILATRYGDCKDHAVVLQALLAAKGIASVPALLNTKPLYELPRIPVMDFNHVILFVPSLGVYLDTNSPSVSFGALPAVDADKPVLLLDGTAAPARTPALKAEANVTSLHTRIRIAADGSASGEDELSASGSDGIYYGGLADLLTGTDPAKVTKALLLAAGLAGEGTATARRLSNEGDFRFNLLYELSDYAPLDQPGSVRPLPPMDFFAARARNEVASAAVRTQPYVCSARIEEEVLDLSFPPGLRITLPRGVSAGGANRSFQSSYRLDGNTVHVERRYESRVPHGVCPAAEFGELRALQEKILKDLRSEIRYTPAQNPGG